MHAPETEPEFTLTSPDDIRAALFELQHADSLIGVRNAYALGRQDDAAPADAGGERSDAGQAAIPGRPQPLSHLGGVFVGLDKRRQSQLQKIVWRLERSRDDR